MDAADESGWTACHWACDRGEWGVLKQLLEAGADPTVRDHEGRLASDVAAAPRRRGRGMVQGSTGARQRCLRMLQEWGGAYLLQRVRRMRDSSSTASAETRMSFADGLKNLKGLIASRKNGSDDTMGDDSTTADGVREEDSAIARRLKAAGTSVRQKGLMKPQPDRRVALLLLIIDSLPFEELWREWIRRGDGRTQVKVWIHAKFPEKVQSRWVQARLIKRSFRPEWGSVEITRATLELMQCALDESRAQRLLLASETCLPVVPLDRAADQIFADQRSWVCARCTPNNGYSKQLQFQPLVNAGVPEELIWKADQWWMLTRHHAESLLELKRAYGEDLWPLFKKVSASDEMYIPTSLALLGAIARGEDAESMVSEVITRRRVTYSFWGDSPKSPETFDGLDEGVLKAAMEDRCLFARKFKGGSVPWEVWMAHMRSLGDSSYGTADEDPLPRLEIEMVDPQQSTRKRKHERE